MLICLIVCGYGVDTVGNVCGVTVTIFEEALDPSGVLCMTTSMITGFDGAFDLAVTRPSHSDGETRTCIHGKL